MPRSSADLADVRLPRSLAALFPGAPRRLLATGSTVAELIADLDAQVPGIRNRIVDAGPEIRTHINIFVAGERATLATPVPDGATVHVIPAVSGGEERFVPVPPAEARPTLTDDRGATGAMPAGDRPVDDPRALQILSTEHWSLLTARSLVYNEAFARGGMFLALLSATLVALGLISTATGFSDGFLIVAGVLLGLDLFVGLGTLGRLATVSVEDIRYLQGMSRLRHAYLEMVPGLDRYFITSGYDDLVSVASLYGWTRPAGTPSVIRGVLHGLTTMPGMVGAICAGIAGMLVAVVLLLLTHAASLAGGAGLAAFLAFYVVQNIVAIRLFFGLRRSLTATFPRPDDDPPPT